MSLFLVIFLSVYACMHLYVFVRARAALHFSSGTGLLIVIFMVLMFFAPFLIRVSEHYGFDLSARILSYVGYIWLGLLFLFSSCAFLLDLWGGGIKAAGYVSAYEFSHLMPSFNLRFFLPLALALLISFYGYFEALNIKTEHIVVRTAKLPEQIRRLRIVQISDVHIGLIVRGSRLSRILSAVQDADPDLLVCTGDLVDGQINGLPGLAEMISGINPPFGKYAVAGNHEYYAGLSQSIGFTERAGFRILKDEGLTVQGVLNIAGVDDPAGRYFNVRRDQSEKELLSSMQNGLFNLLLKHRPIVDKESEGLFDLQLSGHVHKGQIFPFSILTYLYYPVHGGFADLGRGSSLYVSRGSGTWGPPVRFLSPPEVTIIDLVGMQQG